MKSLLTALRCAPLILLLVASACDPTPSGQSDEEKEPHFLAGKSRSTALDYAGAVESFQQALASNPNSAAAHFELAWLFEQKLRDPAAAIYHYERYLKLRPKAENAGVIKDHVLACKQELARTVSLGPVTEKQQRDMERLAEDKERLTQENAALKQEIARLQVELAAQAATAQSAAQTGTTPRESIPTTSAGKTATSTRTSVVPRGNSASSYYPKANRYRRFHRVRSGETLTAISRQYRVSVASIVAANPGLNANRLRAGQEIAIP